ncbi:Adenylosuccinate lyase [Candidatus Xiphinematobacter sp. Idaho Grape]|uniref:adenylosuccinate lyase n=1 Tax=Candidatus Xiphinematobacter sp. Idaho Grape TaxID=1704307 RepID=UPI000705D5E9|nr:adenylosuccinate lyase [Candidatus Xiphinematobacter sp. Idaho Grape]ALJ57011.1 Adenylosuccinate lyase [Candidatus Xiphinematobacter sp. Idaho Grape]
MTPERYSLPGMRALWTEQRKLEIWLEVEVLACEAMAKLGCIPAEDAITIRELAAFDIKKVHEIDSRTHHEIVSFLENVSAHVGPAARWIHRGLTSSDILDTSLAFQMTRSTDILLEDLYALQVAAARMAKKHCLTPMIGRSHGIHAEPITLGLKMALLFDEFVRAEERLRQARERIRVGKISGAVGTHAHLDPAVERFVCSHLGLKPALLSTQIIQRDRHAEFLCVLAVIASSIDRWATEFRHLQRTEVLEVEEFFCEGQKGSSAMPHKRNPVTSEQLSGLARVIRGYAVAALENVTLWHERDISHSSVERIILPDSCILLDYMLVTLCRVISTLQIYPEKMQRNIMLTRGLYASQSILLLLIDKGLERKDAYEVVQRAATRTWKEETISFQRSLSEEPIIRRMLTEEAITAACSFEHHLAKIEDKLKVLGIDQFLQRHKHSCNAQLG